MHWSVGTLESLAHATWSLLNAIRRLKVADRLKLYVAETEKRLRVDTASKLEEEHKQRLRGEAELRGAQAALEAEEGLRRADEVRVVILGEMRCLSSRG